MTDTKTKKNYIYNGLGFPIILEEATFRKIRGEWILKLDVKKLADVVFRVLPHKLTGLTGAEIRFARTHLDMSKRKLAEHLNVSHTAVNKWELSEQSKAHIDPLVEVALRSFLKLQVGGDEDFPNFYRGIMDEAKNFMKEAETEPMKIAI